MTSVQKAHMPVLVGVDGSAPALEAVRWAALEAARSRVGLRLVIAISLMPTGQPGDPRLSPQYRATMVHSAGELLGAAAAVAAQVAPDVEISREVLTGYPVERLVAEAELARMVVVGDRGLGGFGGLLVGSVAVTLAAHAPCPVVMVRGAVSVDGPVVVGVDGSPTSEAAIAFAFEAAAARRAPLVAVHTWQDFTVPAVGLAVTWNEVETEEHQILAERMAGWGEKFPDVPVRRLVTKDRPAHSLVEQSAGAQLLVVGSRGRGSFAGLVLGSVSQALLHHSRCPVAVVRPEAVPR